MKQKNYIAGLYFRLSQEDERQGESVSIENQRTMLRKYAEEHGFEIHGEYIDDGISGTTFDRPEVQRLLDDAKTGVINTIIVKDLSRFGRNYIEVGQYVDYVFPAFGRLRIKNTLPTYGAGYRFTFLGLVLRLDAGFGLRGQWAVTAGVSHSF